MSTPDDELIDRIARAMTHGVPSTQLRQAVRTRIEQEWTPWASREWIPASAAATLVLAAIVTWTLSGPRVEPLRSTQVATALDVTPPVPLESAPLLVSAQLSARSDSGGASRSTRQLITAVPPLVIEPISVPLIAVDASSGVMPIEIDPLQIEALQPQ